MYEKYRNIPVLTRGDKSTKMIIELLVMLNEKLDTLTQQEEREEKKETYSLPVDFGKKFTPHTANKEELKAMTKKELIKLAEKEKVEINPRDKKDIIIEALLG